MDLATVEDGSVLAGLIALEAASVSGRTWTLDDMAFVCGCHPSNIAYIEKRALRKLRAAFENALDTRTVIDVYGSAF